MSTPIYVCVRAGVYVYMCISMYIAELKARNIPYLLFDVFDYFFFDDSNAQYDSLVTNSFEITIIISLKD